MQAEEMVKLEKIKLSEGHEVTTNWEATYCPWLLIPSCSSI
jgi:hypothetical protein